MDILNTFKFLFRFYGSVYNRGAAITRTIFIFSFAFLFSGIGVFGSSFFTAMNDGLTSALISFLRTLVFQTGAVMIFPLIWGLDGIWLSIVLAEAMAVVVL